MAASRLSIAALRRCIAIINRDDNLLDYMQYYVDHCDPSRGEIYTVGSVNNLSKNLSTTAVGLWDDLIILYKDGTVQGLESFV